jgi:hypothetical protein
MRTVETPDRNDHSCRFGRKGSHVAATFAAPSTIASDMRLFALTFAGGFLFMTIFLA